MPNLSGKDVASVRIRTGGAREAVILRDLAIAAKSHWGYEGGWLQEWVEQGGFSEDALRARDIYVAEIDGEPVGWASSILKGDVCWLDDLWVKPLWIGKGVGSRLWRHVAARSAAQGALRMEWEAEPNAIGFYEKMGGTYLRDSESSEMRRVLPIMGVDLREIARA
jgi:GNAT superfamily N-acetyltransferase